MRNEKENCEMLKAIYAYVADKYGIEISKISEDTQLSDMVEKYLSRASDGQTPTPFPYKEKKLFMECAIAGISFHDIDDIWDELCVGAKLALVRERNNAYDKNAVAVALAGDYDGNPDEFDFDFILGYIPRKDNEALTTMLDMGWDDVFETEICKLNRHAPYSDRIHISIYIKNKKIVKVSKNQTTD